AHDYALIRPDAIAPEDLARLVARSHLFKSGGGPIDQRDARAGAEATRVRAFPQANRQHAPRNPEVLDRARQGERVRRDDADVRLDIDEALLVELLRIDDRRVDIGENLEFVGAADVVAVARRAVRDDPPVADLAHLIRLERLDHPLLGGHAANP